MADDTGEDLIQCQRCERLCEGHELTECTICRKKYCTYCAYRTAGHEYCSRRCGQVHFFGGEGDEDSVIDE